MGRHSLAKKLALAVRKPGLEKENVRKMVKAMQARRELRDVASALLAFEDNYETGNPLNIRCGPLVLRYVEAVSYPASDPAKILCESSEYDPFNFILLADSEANAAAASRAAWSRPEAYGVTDDWIIWAYDAQLGGLLKFQASGYLSALHNRFPDEATRALATAYGIDLSAAERPLLIMRAADFGKFVAQEVED